MNNKWFKISGLVATAAIVGGIAIGTSAYAQSPTPTQTPGYGRGMSGMTVGGMTTGSGMTGGGMGMIARGVMGGQENSLVAIAAKTFNISQADLVATLNGGKTIADVAKEKGVALDTIVDAAITTRVDWMKTAVSSGRLTQAQADANLATMKANITTQLSAKFTPRGNGAGTGTGSTFVDSDGDGVCDNMGTAVQTGAARGQMNRGGRWNK
jgi:hypothetical protein